MLLADLQDIFQITVCSHSLHNKVLFSETHIGRKQKEGRTFSSLSVLDPFSLRFLDQLNVSVEGGFGDSKLVADFLHREPFCFVQMPGSKGGLIRFFR